MNVVEAARRLAETLTAEPGTFEDLLCPCRCDVTYVIRMGEAGFASPHYSHADDCPTVMLPQIVAALEATARLVEGVKGQNLARPYPDQHPIEDELAAFDDDGDINTCFGCGGQSHGWNRIPHEPECAWLALLAATPPASPAPRPAPAE